MEYDVESINTDAYHGFSLEQTEQADQAEEPDQAEQADGEAEALAPDAESSRAHGRSLL